MHKVLSKSAKIATIRKHNLLNSFAVVGNRKSLSTKVKQDHLIKIPCWKHKLINILVPDFKHYSSSSVNSNNNNNTIQVLNPVQYKTWSKEDVCSLLCTPEENGGAGLTIEDVKPLYDVGFDGVSLANIVTYIQDEDEFFAIEQLKYYQNISRTTLKSVVNWVDNLLKTRLYHLWSTDQLTLQLSSPKHKGGIGIDHSNFNHLYNIGFDGYYLVQIANDIASKGESYAISQLENIPYDFPLSAQQVATCQSVVSWVGKTMFMTVTPRIFDNAHLLWYHLDKLLLTGDFSSPIIQERFYFKSLLHRESAGIELEHVAKKHLDNYLFGAQKNEYYFVTIKGGSGSGKSRLLKESINIIKERCIENPIFAHTRIFYFSFLNGFSRLTNEDNDLERMLVNRLLKIAFGDNNLDTQGVTLSQVLKYISLRLHNQSNLPIEQPIPLIIAFDEYQLLTRERPEFKTRMQHLFGDFMTSRDGGLVIIPILCGTLINTDVPLIPTSYGRQILNVPALRSIDIEQILQQEQIPEPFITNLKPLWLMIGIIPRHLHWLVQCVRENERKWIDQLENLDNNERDIWLDIFNFLVSYIMKMKNSSYGLENTSGSIYYLYNKAAYLLFSGFTKDDYNSIKGDLAITEDHQQIWNTYFEPLYQEGRLYSGDNGYFVPNMLLGEVLNTTSLTLGSFSFTIQNMTADWKGFEQVTMCVMYSKLMTLCQLYPNGCSVPIETLFRGAIFSEKLKGLSFKIPPNAEFSFSSEHKPIKTQKWKKPIVGIAKEAEDALDGYFGPLKPSHRAKKTIVVTQNKFSSQRTNFSPSELEDCLKKLDAKTASLKKKFNVVYVFFVNCNVHGTVEEIVKAKDNIILVNRDACTKVFPPNISILL